jgi:hypothetical protein
MKVKITIPDEITIDQFQKIDAISKSNLSGFEMDNEIIEVFTGIKNAGDITQLDRIFLTDTIEKALLKEGEFKQRFVLNGIEFGMIPNFDKITGSEYDDLIRYFGKDEFLHLFMAVGFRPIKLKDNFKNYQIVNYSGTSELSEIMKQTPIAIAKGFNVFFWSLSKTLEASIQKSMAEERAKEIAH